jgi:hypothetical protein
MNKLVHNKFILIAGSAFVVAVFWWGASAIIAVRTPPTPSQPFVGQCNNPPAQVSTTFLIAHYDDGTCEWNRYDDKPVGTFMVICWINTLPRGWSQTAVFSGQNNCDQHADPDAHTQEQVYRDF